MLTVTEDVQPLTALQSNSVAIMRHLKHTQRPITLTVNGNAEAILQDPVLYERLRDLAALVNEEEGIRQGEEDIRMGRTRLAREVLEEIRIALGIPR